MDKVNTLKRIGSHLFHAASAGVDVMLQDKEEGDALTTVVAGNNRTGKTTLLYTAKFGPAFNRKLVVPTVGYNLEVLDVGNKAEMAVVDVGGGARMGPFFYKHVADADALVYVVRADDPRFVSAAWELYLLLHTNPNLHVTVLLTSDTSVDAATARLMTRLLHPDALPPTRTNWTRIFELYNVQPHEDKWTADRDWIQHKRRTASHGMPLAEHLAQDVQLVHKKSWTVTRLPPCTALMQDQALQPFVDLFARLAPATVKPKANLLDC